MSRDPDQLELVETDALLDELCRRFDHVIFAGLKRANGGSDYVQRQWKGNQLTCSGLANWAIRKTLDDYDRVGCDGDDEGNPIDDDDEE